MNKYMGFTKQNHGNYEEKHETGFILSSWFYFSEITLVAGLCKYLITTVNSNKFFSITLITVFKKKNSLIDLNGV